MKMANVAELKKHLSAYVAMAEEGESIEVRRRNVPVARLVGIAHTASNRTQLGCGRGTGTVLGDLAEPLLPTDRWDMLRKEG
jgi:prevent-host-death family protein